MKYGRVASICRLKWEWKGEEKRRLWIHLEQELRERYRLKRKGQNLRGLRENDGKVVCPFVGQKEFLVREMIGW
jgi:hypothetical protein